MRESRQRKKAAAGAKPARREFVTDALAFRDFVQERNRLVRERNTVRQSGPRVFDS
jgi:hypothetical protein